MHPTNNGSHNSGTPHSAAIGLASVSASDEVIEVFYPSPQLNPAAKSVSILCQYLGLSKSENGWARITGPDRRLLANALAGAGETTWAELISSTDIDHTLLACVNHMDATPVSIPEVFLKLHLLSHRLVKPQTLVLDGMFALLKNLAWTSEGAIELDELPARQLAARQRGEVLDVHSVDKFPKMTTYVVPSGVRLADTARIRLGAYIGEGTTVMHEGFVNFNAGTLGTAMVEGRISAGVVVGEDSDLGGGSSTMGTLSGGGSIIISVGRNCLIGANAGIGFPLPDGCIIEAGLYVTGGTKVNVLAQDGSLNKTCKAHELASTTSLLYRRNSLSGAVEAIPITHSIDLNTELHSHN
ncbi:MAG: DapH/DapD/GlmU-related protein [Gammaproteobacteria bacterium]|nr:DapH/DapD/GlmU-related protein [Gammaproteobacteria bacterium]MCY4356519.1 DapH/DapD/GlmU-related protein [Gammaproteobacteria bacterium]